MREDVVENDGVGAGVSWERGLAEVDAGGCKVWGWFGEEVRREAIGKVDL